MRTHRSVTLIRRTAVLTAIMSLATYPSLVLLLRSLGTITNHPFALQVLAIAPYGVALSIAALGVAHHLDVRHRARKHHGTSRTETLLAVTVNTIIWAAASLISIPVTTVVLYLITWL